MKRSLFISIRAAIDDVFALAATKKRTFIEDLWSPVDIIERADSLSRLHLLTIQTLHK